MDVPSVEVTAALKALSEKHEAAKQAGDLEAMLTAWREYCDLLKSVIVGVDTETVGIVVEDTDGY